MNSLSDRCKMLIDAARGKDHLIQRYLSLLNTSTLRVLNPDDGEEKELDDLESQFEGVVRCWLKSRGMSVRGALEADDVAGFLRSRGVSTTDEAQTERLAAVDLSGVDHLLGRLHKERQGSVGVPRTRPVVMNPVDHPMGGGEGKSSGGHPRSRNGIPAKGFRTRSKTKQSNKYIIERRKK